MHEINAKSILSAQNGMNLYRGCTHGCIYCDARSKCYHTPEPFEDIEIKVNAPELLEDALKRKRKKCMIGTGSMSDPYIHLEEKLGLTRKCLEIIDHYGFGLAIQTKSTRILRDLDLLESINKKAKCVVQMTLTTYDENLCRIVEPNVSTTRERFEALKIFRDHGIPTVVWMTPVLPYLNDTMENLNGILDYCLEAKVVGIIAFGMGLTLREGDREYYYAALDKHFPGLKQRYLDRFGWNAYELSSPDYWNLTRRFNDFCGRNGIMNKPDEIFGYMRDFPEQEKPQQLLFDF
ncbi:SPL family radical SAM protein [Treponema sp.]|uniref:SPL family radical SAM protein n=1 Tax=Treponema sp. TaxID=166 RepID=UPI00298D99B1|nr:radical SAM protein [Treponema sp.]MCQ2241645.1 radical SAM protein [Treponema sp.]